ncbi:DUF3971 domain-containing protein [Microvirga makkahensis]|uniref:DUF3971 domain-containing protein n=1 Tax=Microvirga makkahensis TaxID=1128670 RepID=A0A7X3MSN9_9HYPH|nr:DUF3971 domain-containing protein [Microvirga makkahensis]MXQ12436.1 hypothetical protein [Microvirga makkahensis]
MKVPLRTTLPRQEPAKRSLLGRLIRGTLYAKLGLITLLIVAAGVFYLRLSVAPLSFGRLPERVAEALASRIGAGWTVALRNTAIELHEGIPALRANGLDIRGPSGELVVRAPYALVSVDFLSLLTANLQPKAIHVRDLQLRVLVNRDGSLTFSPVQGAEEDQVRGAPVPEPDPSRAAAASLAASADGPSLVSGAVGSLFDLIVGPRSVLNTLGKAQLTNARLIFIDADYRERARFERVDATFDWDHQGGRHFSAMVEGPQGPWWLRGDAKAEGRDAYRAAFVADSAPIQDIMVLSGMSSLPAATDLEFSGRFDVAYANGRVTELKTRLDSNAGFIRIEDKDTSPLPVDRATIVAEWNETDKTLSLPTLELKGGDTYVNLQGMLSAPTVHQPWRLRLTGKDIVWAGAAPGDAPLRVSQMDADLSGPDGVMLNSIRLRGPRLHVDIGGALAETADPKGLKFDVTASKTEIRSALRIWPEAVAPPVRRFLVENLKSGTLEDFRLKIAMTGADVERSMSGGPIPDESVKIDFVISQGTFQAAEGLPPISEVDVTGRVTGTKVTLRAPTGRVDMAGNHSLSASEGSFALDNYWDDNAVARIDFRLTGAADGVGAMLQQPLVKEIAGFEVDPSGMKGKADLRVGIGLPVNDIPAIAELPLTVTGTLNDLTLDRLFDKEKLETGNLTIAYDRGDLSIKGDGKIGGGAATIDVQKNRQGGQAIVAFTLDEAARSRRGFSFGSQLTGIVNLKVAVPLGRSDAAGMTVEADLTKAGIDHLIPGWVKPAGRPGKLTFTMSDGPEAEIRDLQLDSGAVQLRGTAALSKEGEFERAELSTFKLSPGDDMRAQVESSGGVYKVIVRGNVGDARPFVKSLSSQSLGRDGSGQKQSKDFDLDLNLNILTGYNNEAITNAVIKASMRKEVLRHLEMKGRLGATNVAARTDTQGRNGSVIIVQAEDAGALLRFADVYKRMVGGDLIINMATGEGQQPGILLLRSFTLVNEPALRRIIPTQTQMVAGQDRSGNPRLVRVDVNEVTFARARADFTRTSGRVDFREAAIYGNQIGFTLDGYIDYSRDRMDISGTFVPAYGLNNVFAKVPLFGPLLGGSQYEGLFAVNFRAVGPASAPNLTVNPLSAVAPGFLRKLFGVGAGPQQTDALPAIPDR